MRWQKREQKVQLDLYYVEVDVADVYTQGSKTEQFPVYLPLELFAVVHRSGCYEQVFGTKTEEFWDCVRGSEWARVHPVFENESMLKWTYPVRMHGDDAAMRSLQNQKLVIVSFHSALSTLSSLKSRLLSFAIRDKLLIARKTLQQLFVVIAWAMNVVFAGRWPTTDHLGEPLPELYGRKVGAHRYAMRTTPLAGPYRFAFTGALGDQDWHDKVYYPVLILGDTTFAVSGVVHRRFLLNFISWTFRTMLAGGTPLFKQQYFWNPWVLVRLTHSCIL